MELNTIKVKMGSLIKKYRYMVLLVIIGIVLLLLPSKTSENTENKASPTQMQNSDPVTPSIEQLEQILSSIDGAGNVRVLLSEAISSEMIYQIDSNPVTGSEFEQYKTETVIITDSNRSQSGLMRQIKAPTYRGAVIVCQGGGDPVVRLAIVSAVSKLTGLGADSICVLKMK